MKRWFKYIKPYMLYFITGPLCMIVEVVGEVFMPFFMAQIINNYSAGNLTVGSSLWYMVGMIATALCMMIGGVGGAYFGAKASVNFAADIRSDVYRKVQAFSFANIDRFSTGSLVTRLTNDVTQLQNFVNMLLRMALRAPGMMIGALIMAIALEPRLSMIFVVSIPVLLAAVFIITKMGFPRFTRMQAKIDRLNSTVQENITNVRVVKSFVREDFEEQKFAKANSDLKNGSNEGNDYAPAHYESLYVRYHNGCRVVRKQAGYGQWHGGRKSFGIHNLCYSDTYVFAYGHHAVYVFLPCHGVGRAYFRGAGRGA